MNGMTQTNYWNPCVNYMAKSSAQSFMENIRESRDVVATGPCTGCSSECSPCDVGSSGECGSCSSFAS